MMLPDPEELKRKDEIDRLITRTNYYRRRGEFDRVEEECGRILELEPEHSLAREWLADILHERGKLLEAADAYKALMQKDSSNASAEEKYARVMLEIAEQEREKTLAQEMIDNPEKFHRPERSPLIVLLLSILLPGLGHLYLQEIIKGAILISSFAICCTVLAFSSGTAELVRQAVNMLAFGYGLQVEGVRQPIGFAACFFSAVLLFTYVYAIIDAPILASKSEVARRKEREGKI